jgi:two-component system, OmpR family, sensor histidine kinase CiaH
MFAKASVRLAAWYVAILMGLSLAFSVWLYNEATQQIESGFNGPVGASLNTYYGWETQGIVRSAIAQQVASGKARIVGQLVVLNLGVLVCGAIASYYLARRTLQPVEDAMEAQNRFTADASHELRTPLAAMKTEIEVALRQPNLSEDEVKDILASNLEEVDRMSTLSQNLLALARSQSPPHMSAVQADKIAADVAKRLQPLATTNKITIKKQLQPLKVLGNTKHIDVVLGILLDNAIKYSPEKSTIIVATGLKDGFGYMTVKDDGHGIAEDDLPHIFERFYRADSSRSKGHAVGHGLGLSIAQKMAHDIRGLILVESTKDQGSTFSLRLPIAQ